MGGLNQNELKGLGGGGRIHRGLFRGPPILTPDDEVGHLSDEEGLLGVHRYANQTIGANLYRKGQRVA